MFTRHKCSLPTLALGLAAVFLLALGSGCGGSDPGPDFGTNNPELIVAMGDSITFGLGDVGVDDCSESSRRVGGFCPRLQGLSEKTVVNDGVCGAMSGDGAASVQYVLSRRSPGVLLILYSPNDIFNGTDEVIRNLRTMIGAAISNMTVPVVGTLTPSTGEHRGWEPFIESLNAQIRALCVELKVECADHNAAFKEDPGYAISPYALLSKDGLHPNSAGYDVMATTWNKALKKVY
jgi:lysophospholipase L1-like esterase